MGEGERFQPARWGGSGKKSVQAVSTRSTPAVEIQPTLIETETEPEPTGPDATDAAKALAAEHNIDLTAIAGTGLDGRVTKEDVAALVPAEPEGEPDEQDTGSTGDDG